MTFMARPVSVRPSAGVRAPLFTAALVLLGSLLVTPAAGDDIAAPAEGELVARINSERSARGMAPLVPAEDLASIAREWSRRMADTSQISHHPTLADDVSGWSRLSENVGHGPDVASIHLGLMSSAEHRANILDDRVTQIGVGTAFAGERLYVTQLFRLPEAPAVDRAPTEIPAPEPTGQTPTSPPPVGPVAPPPAVSPVLPAPPPVPPVPSPVPPKTFPGPVMTPPPHTPVPPPSPPARVPQPQTPSETANSPLSHLRVACPGAVPPAGFTDVPTDSSHASSIDCAVWWSLVKGVGAGQFQPQREVSRAQMASFLTRVLRVAGLVPTATRDHFTDDHGSVHESSINVLAELGVARGNGQGSFAPDTPVTRDQMATFLVGVHELVTGSTMPVGPVPFRDAGGAHATSIGKLYAATLTTGIDATSYGAGIPVKREQLATFLMRSMELLLRNNHVMPRG
jgi:hypothetical protein